MPNATDDQPPLRPQREMFDEVKNLSARGRSEEVMFPMKLEVAPGRSEVWASLPDWFT